MPKQHLTDRFIKSLRPPQKRIEYYDQHLINLETGTLKAKGVNGLLVRVTPAGNKLFYYSYWHAGKSKRFKIGDYPNLSLSDARDKARELAGQVNEGIDPMEAKRKAKQVRRPVTFKELADQFKAIHLKPLREKTKTEHSRIIDNELVPAFGENRAKQLTKAQIIALLDKKAITNETPTMANRIRARLHSIYEFGIGRGIVENNPVTGVKRYPEGETKRERFYSEKELALLWKAFEEQAEPAGSVMKMLLLTGQRKTETMNMKWSDINRDVWTIPAELAKGKRSHDVPLSDMALDMLDRMRMINQGKAWVFASPVLEDAPVQEIKRSIKKVRKFTDGDDFCVSDFRLHDLRRTAATYMAKLGVDRTTLGKILNHKGLAGDGQVTAIYDRHSYMAEKRQALQRWANLLQQILSGAETKIHRIG